MEGKGFPREAVKKLVAVPTNSEQALSQYAALCYRISARNNPKVLLVTSRETGRWVIPKGWPMPNRSGGECALTEAYEEAGVFGRLYDVCVGYYTYNKVLGPRVEVPCVVAVYPVNVLGLRDDFPEKDQRRRKWFSPQAAAERVAEPELSVILEGFDASRLDHPFANGN
jgi:8-oxo-dGTP pyrophosphatase MutT (NUDIX family)